MGYSSPAQSGITTDLNLSVAEVTTIHSNFKLLCFFVVNGHVQFIDLPHSIMSTGYSQLRVMVILHSTHSLVQY